jgi:hypothetical protein
MLPNQTQFATSEGPRQFSKPHIYECDLHGEVLILTLTLTLTLSVTSTARSPGRACQSFAAYSMPCPPPPPQALSSYQHGADP